MTMIAVRAAAAVAGLAGVLAACGGGSTPAAYTFNKSQPSCKVHQERMPSGAYVTAVAGIGSFSIAQAGFLQDYTPHQVQPFCGGGEATSVDLAWAALFAKLSKALPGSNSSDLDRPDLSDP